MPGEQDEARLEMQRKQAAVAAVAAADAVGECLRHLGERGLFSGAQSLSAGDIQQVLVLLAPDLLALELR